MEVSSLDREEGLGVELTNFSLL